MGYLHKVLAGSLVCRGVEVVGERASIACLTLTLSKELAWYVLGICPIFSQGTIGLGRIVVVLLFGPPRGLLATSNICGGATPPPFLCPMPGTGIPLSFCLP